MPPASPALRTPFAPVSHFWLAAALAQFTLLGIGLSTYRWNLVQLVTTSLGFHASLLWLLGGWLALGQRRKLARRSLGVIACVETLRVVATLTDHGEQLTMLLGPNIVTAWPYARAAIFGLAMTGRSRWLVLGLAALQLAWQRLPSNQHYAALGWAAYCAQPLLSLVGMHYLGRNRLVQLPRTLARGYAMLLAIAIIQFTIFPLLWSSVARNEPGDYAWLATLALLIGYIYIVSLGGVMLTGTRSLWVMGTSALIALSALSLNYAQAYHPSWVPGPPTAMLHMTALAWLASLWLAAVAAWLDTPRPQAPASRFAWELAPMLGIVIGLTKLYLRCGTLFGPSTMVTTLSLGVAYAVLTLSVLSRVTTRLRANLPAASLPKVQSHD